MTQTGLLQMLTLLFLITGCKVSYSQSDPNARDLRVLTEWFEGVFDNDSQLWYEGRRTWTGNPDEKHGRIHATHKRLDASDIGNHVFYIEEYIDDDPAQIARQRVVSFESIPETNEIAMRLYFLKDADKYLLDSNVHMAFPVIGQEDLFAIDGCDVFFIRVGEQYHGSMRQKGCQFGEGELRRYSVHDMTISKNQYWRVDRTFLVSNDKFHKGHPNAEPHKMRRAKNYSCDVSFHEKAYYIPSDNDKKYEGALIHNQGGMQWFDNPINGKKYGVQLREKEYPFYEEGSDFFMLRFIEEGALASTVIVTTAPNAPSLSFQIGWASANCKRMKD